jgi:Rrf2 family cysteine metabolism transcriptional repressor
MLQCQRAAKRHKRGFKVFTVSAKAIYGLCAMIELGENYGGDPIQIKDIAGAHDIPQHYLEQLLVILKKAGLVQSFRGTSGGYALAKPASQISVLEVLTCLDGKIEVLPERKKNNAISFFWNDLQSAIESQLDVSLEDLLLKMQDSKGKFIYTI